MATPRPAPDAAAQQPVLPVVGFVVWLVLMGLG
jgi:hypothetical protein